MTLMRLSARADYALRAAIELAAASSGHVTADQLARAQQIPGKFLETILTQLRRAGLIRSQRGPDGGFWLARPAAEISLADIIRVIDGQLLGVRGERPENITYPGAAEPLQQVWIALRANERAVLEHLDSAREADTAAPFAGAAAVGDQPVVPHADVRMDLLDRFDRRVTARAQHADRNDRAIPLRALRLALVRGPAVHHQLPDL